MKGIIIAAGYGSRLRPLTDNTPKALVEIEGKPIITYPIDALVAAGISDISVVVGYRADVIMNNIEKLYPSISFSYNKDYDGDNAISIFAARSFIDGDPFVLAMGDHLISSSLVTTLLSDSTITRTLCVDSESKNASQVNDGTRVMADPKGRIIRIGKDLKDWQSIDTGLFMMDAEVLDNIKYLRSLQGNKVTISEVVQHMGDNGRHFQTCDVSGQFWADVDTEEDYDSVSALLKEGV
ncbi:MAG: CDP-L-myo-inositol myo-inositolphosphotransferase [Chloroflexi bacterium]|jgi:choline kinase|nr:MAG: CDP-L-myo-inositol myo-inositolphosphotransferase [Chloroflexota bacterium]